MQIGWYVKDGFRQSAVAKRTRYNCNTITVKRLLGKTEQVMPVACMLLSKQVVQMAEDFELDGIQKLADELDAC
jgi:hypothetical protein